MPRMPMVAVGVCTPTRSRLRLPMAPVTARAGRPRASTAGMLSRARLGGIRTGSVAATAELGRSTTSDSSVNLMRA